MSLLHPDTQGALRDGNAVEHRLPLPAMQAASVPWRSSTRFGFPGEAAFSELRNRAWEDFLKSLDFLMWKLTLC